MAAPGVPHPHTTQTTEESKQAPEVGLQFPSLPQGGARQTLWEVGLQAEASRRRPRKSFSLSLAGSALEMA